MKYAYENLSDKQFEDLVVLICQELLGISVQGFCPGPDGGRDAKFVGTAQLHPSTASPWIGTTIIQAKHTNAYNRHFGEADFFSHGSTCCVLSKEIPRIKKLCDSGELDHYMLFANRRLSGGVESDIRDHISKECGIPIGSIYLCSVEQLEMWLKRFPVISRMANLDPVDSPLIVSPDDLADVVEALGRHMTSAAQAVVDHAPTERTTYEKKNKLNNMTPEYAKELRSKYLKDTVQIKAFLAAPENSDLMIRYESTADEFKLKIIARRNDYQTFDRVMDYLVDLLFGRDPILRQSKHKRLTRAVLFYMYWNCDIGEVADATTE